MQKKIDIMRLKPFNTTLAIITLAIIVGIVFQDNLHLTFSIIVSLMGVSILAGVLLFFRFEKIAFLGVFLMSFCLGMLIYAIHYQPNNKNHYIQKLQSNQFYTLKGKIIEIKDKKAIIDLQNSDNQKVTGKVQLSFSDTLSIENLGKSLLFRTKLNPISEVKNPYQFDYQKYMSRQNIFWAGYVTDFQIFPATDFSLRIFAARLQNKVASSLNNYPFSAESQGIIKALLLGIRQDVSEEIYQQYIDAGAIHILAISGLHIGIIAMILSYILHFIFRNKKYNVLILSVLIIFLWAYALLTGLSASVVRAVTMFSFLSVALELKKYQGVYDNLIASIFILLIINPLYLYDVGFQLSYLAVFSIMTFLPIFNRWWFPENKIIRFFYGILVVSFSAQIGVLPISLYYFHQFPSLFFITNLFVLPFLGIILGVGILVITLASLNILPSFLVIGYDFLIRQMNAVIGFVSSFNDFIFRQIYFDEKMLVLAFTGIILLAFWLHFKKIQFLYGILGSIFIFQAILFYNKYEIEKTAELIVFQQYNTTLLGVRQGEKMSFFYGEKDKLPQKYITNFTTQKNIKNIDYHKITNVFSFKGKIFVVLDGIWYIDNSFAKIDYLILRNSPKIHLDKLLQLIRPQVIIADGSNTPWLTEIWKKTCEKKNIPFHFTGEKGYFQVKSN